MVPTTSPKSPEYEVTSKSLSAELRRKSLSFMNGRGDFFFTCSSFEHPSNGMRVELHSRQLGEML